MFTVDELSIPRLKDLAVGILGAQEWVNDLPNEANKKFVADYIAKYKLRPSFYGAQTYDGVSLINSAVDGGPRRSLEKGRHAPRNGEGRFQIRSRQLQVRQ